MWRSHSGEISALIPAVDIRGIVDPDFQPVRDAFLHNFVEHGEIGASLCVLIHGRPVVDIAAGHLDDAGTTSWQIDTLVNSFSVGKGILAIVLADLVAQNTVDLDQPVSRVWPELLAGQNSTATLRDLAGHRMGLPALSESLDASSLYDWQTMCAALEQQFPWWEPGTQHGYHVNTFGFLIGEVINRITSHGPSHLLDAFRNVVTNHMYFGVPTAELHRVATLQWNPPTSPHAATYAHELIDDDTRLKLLTYSNPENFSGVTAVNTTQWRQSVHPSTNLHASARGVAYMYDTLRFDSRRIPPSVVEEFSQTVSFGQDAILGAETHFGTGFQLPTPQRSFGPNRNAIGHYGAGGAVGFYDPTTGISFGYVMNKMGQGWQNARNQALISSLYACL